jgi:hypothetical protein
MSVDAKLKLFRAIRAHTSILEIERDNATGLNREALGGRTEATRQLLECSSKLVSLSRRSPQQLKRRYHQASQLIRIKLRRPRPVRQRLLTRHQITNKKSHNLAVGAHQTRPDGHPRSSHYHLAERNSYFACLASRI